MDDGRERDGTEGMEGMGGAVVNVDTLWARMVELCLGRGHCGSVDCRRWELLHSNPEHSWELCHSRQGRGTVVTSQIVDLSGLGLAEQVLGRSFPVTHDSPATATATPEALDMGRTTMGPVANLTSWTSEPASYEETHRNNGEGRLDCARESQETGLLVSLCKVRAVCMALSPESTSLRENGLHMLEG